MAVVPGHGPGQHACYSPVLLTAVGTALRRRHHSHGSIEERTTLLKRVEGDSVLRAVHLEDGAGVSDTTLLEDVPLHDDLVGKEDFAALKATFGDSLEDSLELFCPDLFWRGRGREVSRLREHDLLEPVENLILFGLVSEFLFCWNRLDVNLLLGQFCTGAFILRAGDRHLARLVGSTAHRLPVDSLAALCGGNVVELLHGGDTHHAGAVRAHATGAELDVSGLVEAPCLTLDYGADAFVPGDHASADALCQFPRAGVAVAGIGLRQRRLALPLHLLALVRRLGRRAIGRVLDGLDTARREEERAGEEDGD